MKFTCSQIHPNTGKLADPRKSCLQRTLSPRAWHSTGARDSRAYGVYSMVQEV